jgi:Domain of unknown function (DUF7007)
MIQRCSLPEGCPKHSPWGAVDHGERLAEGVFFVSTPRHGGFKLAAKHNVLIPAAFRREGGWYEEDCDAAIPMFFMPLLFKPEQVLEARESLRCWHWREWEAHFGEIVPLEESLCKAQTTFVEEHANDLLVISASGDWHRAVVTGMVGVTATVQGSRKPGSQHHHFLVTKDEYATRQNNPGGIFVIDPARHQPWDPEVTS